MNLKFVLTALAAFSATGVAHCALIPSTLYVEEHRIPNFENTIQNNASTIVTNGQQRVQVIADRTYKVPGSDRQIIFLSGNDYQRFKSSLPAGSNSGPGFRARIYSDSNGQQPPPQQAQARAQPYSSAHEAVHRSSLEGQTRPARGESHSEIQSSGSLHWDSSNAWTTPTPTPTPSSARPPHEYEYNYHRYASRAREGTYQPTRPAEIQPHPQSESGVRKREREPYENILRLHRNEQLPIPDSSDSSTGSEWESEWRAAGRPQSASQTSGDRQRQPVHPSRLRSLGNDVEAETRTDAYGYDYPAGYQRYADTALGGAGAEYRAAPAPAEEQYERYPNYNYYPSSRPTDYLPTPSPPSGHYPVYPPQAVATPTATAQPSYISYPQGRGSTANYHSNGDARRSKCCVITYTCVLINGYPNGGRGQVGNDRDRDGRNQRRHICKPKTTTMTTPRPKDVGVGRKCCCCCCYVCC